ncbi:RNA-guided endonuclease TnpB family protein [Mycobacterium sp. E136]|uniref:RNA-guided endonuclease TnpB family protein n=1 Tax=Mycobacterium sp. E136 TaxID=1834125 RepID=UPI00336BD1AD
MTRHTTFKFCLDPTAEQRDALTRHAGASRFAYNQCVRMVQSAMRAQRAGERIAMPRTGFDLIIAFNRWKKSEAAGRVWAVASDGSAELISTGLAWRDEICQQVFEEGAVDCARALTAWSDSRSGRRKGGRIGFPKFKKKKSTPPAFRMRNTQRKGRRPAIRIGDAGRTRSVSLPRIGVVAVHDDTRRLRRMLATNRARILFATVSHRAGRWWVALNVEAEDLHPALRHPPRSDADRSGWVGVDRGLMAFAVAADVSGALVTRVGAPPQPLRRAVTRQRRLARELARRKRGSHGHEITLLKLRRLHHRVANVRRHFLHGVSNSLVKNHDRLVLEDLNVSGMLANHRLAQAISDAGWSEFARILRYKQAWRGGQLVYANRYFPSTKRCSRCGAVRTQMELGERLFSCECGHTADRDHNAAVNLALWAQETADQPPDPQAGGRVTNARGRNGGNQLGARAGYVAPIEAGTKVRTHSELRTPEEGGATSQPRSDTLDSSVGSHARRQRLRDSESPPIEWLRPRSSLGRAADF